MAEGQSPRKPLGSVRDGFPDEGGSIKIGSRARVGGALPTAVDEGDRVPLLVDEFGRLIVSGGAAGVQVEGLTPHDDPDPGTENPVYVGGFATNTPSGHAVSGDGDRAGLVTDRQSRVRARLSGQAADSKAHLDVPLDDYGALMVGGATAHGSALEATNYPLKLGAVAEDEAPAAVDDGDMVRLFADLVGRLQINHPLGIAGENLVQDWLRTVQAPAAVEQDSILFQTVIATANNIVAKASAGRIYSAWAYNATGAVAYLQVRNGTATGVPTHAVLAIPNGESGSIVLDGERGKYHDTGIVVQLSSTPNTFTGVTAADCHLSVGYF